MIAHTATSLVAPMPLSPRVVLDAWRGITRTHVRVTFLIGVGLFLYYAITRFGSGHHGLGRAPAVWLPLFVYSQVAAFAVMLCVVVADRVTGSALARRGTYACAVLAGCAAGMGGQWLMVYLVRNVVRPAEVVAYIGLELVMLASGGVLIYLDRRRAQAARARMHAAELDRVSASKRMLESRLQAMQARVEPQFLFNTLAQVKALYERDVARGESVLDDLIAYLRAAMPRMRDTSSTVGQEVDLVRAFLAIARMRMGERLDFSIDLPPELRDARLPPMMLLPLVDPIIQHECRSIRIAVDLGDGRLRVAVAGDSAAIPESSVAIDGIRERLAGLYSDRAFLTLRTLHDGGTEALLELPYERGALDTDTSTMPFVAATVGDRSSA